MHLKLKDKQLKTILFIYRLLYQTSWQPQTENLQQIHTKKAIQTNAKVSHQITREEKQRGKGRKKIYKNKSKTIKKMAIGTYISIITLNVNELNDPIKRQECLNRYKNKTHI